MEGFDTSTMTYMTTPVNMPYDNAPDPYSKMLMQTVDTFDHHSNYDANTFAGYHYSTRCAERVHCADKLIYLGARIYMDYSPRPRLR